MEENLVNNNNNLLLLEGKRARCGLCSEISATGFVPSNPEACTNLTDLKRRLGNLPSEPVDPSFTSDDLLE